ncbi:hypothetical protein FHX42_003905 [Saccharopolyspora lacisalsi]|uniref:Uncharacterized protein n=1 Tax=Halosaccharopolyspora lacisalsi TaxID=1000566 RepID=A0A839E0U0_9PSEU|nr:hypothetical protein [Halosaccharopolyspora lacisalsi]MBA8826529.1 hypothetical protein [Halosaccharopolyspora lacisalsi]
MTTSERGELEQLRNGYHTVRTERDLSGARRSTSPVTEVKYSVIAAERAKDPPQHTMTFTGDMLGVIGNATTNGSTKSSHSSNAVTQPRRGESRQSWSGIGTGWTPGGCGASSTTTSTEPIRSAISVMTPGAELWPLT